jgi:hypothetical protein
MKQPSPFNPLEDNLLGQILCGIYSEKGNLSELKNKIQSLIPEGETSFYFTPRIDKSTLLTVLPDQFRKMHAENNIEGMKVQLNELVHPPDKIIRLDVILELLEWVITGLSSDIVSLELLRVLLGEELIDLDIVQLIIQNYEKMVTSEK